MKCLARSLLCFLVMAVALPVGAQQFTGGVRGSVSDPNGVIPGVTVTLKNEGTNVSRQTPPHALGQYNFPAVPPGTYALAASIPGFKKFRAKGLVVGAQQFIQLDVK